MNLKTLSKLKMIKSPQCGFFVWCLQSHYEWSSVRVLLLSD